MMPYAPPATLTGVPAEQTLKAGTELWRTHRGRDTALCFDPPSVGVYGGRRFDGSWSSPHRCLYASFERGTAIAEEILPAFDVSPTVPRFLTRETLADLHVSGVRVNEDLRLLRLVTGQDIAAVHADTWLLSERDGHYPTTREWAGWFREKGDWAGIVWTSMFDMPKTTVVLFEDRTAGVLSVRPGRTVDLGAEEPPDWLACTMAGWGVHVGPPVPARPRVFLNYRNGIADQVVMMIQNELAGLWGERGVFRASKSIPPGEKFQPYLLRNAAGVKVMLAVIGRGWEDDPRLCDPEDWVRKEIQHAHDNGVTVIPVLVGARNRLRAEDLPASIKWLADVQDMTITGDAEQPDIAQFVKRLLRRRPELNED
jgi:hypothetical protein